MHIFGKINAQRFYLGAVFLVSLMILGFKFFWVVLDYRHIPPGFDSERLMIDISNSLATESLNMFTAPHGAMHYIAMAIKLLTGLSSVDMLFIPLFFYTFFSFFIFYFFSRRLANNSIVSAFASILFALPLIVPIVSYSSHFAFLALPTFILALFYYLRGIAGLGALMLTIEGMLLTYPSLPYLILMLFSLAVMILLLRAIESNDKEMVFRFADYFIALPILYIANYFATNNLVIPTYQGLEHYVKITLGLWRFQGDKLFILSPFLLFLAVSAVFFFGQFFYPLIQPAAKKILDFLRSILKIFKKGNYHPLEILALVIFFSVIFELAINLLFFHDGEPIGVTYYFFSYFFGKELWKSYAFSYYPYFILFPAGLILLYKEDFFESLRKTHLWYAILPLSIFLLAIIPAEINPLNNFFGERGYRALTIFITTFSAIILYTCLKRKNLKNSMIYLLVFMILSSTIFSFTGMASTYPQNPNKIVINDYRWLENNLINHRIFYLVPNFFQGDLDAQTKFYSFAFVDSEIKFEHMLEVNHQRIVEDNFNKFVTILNNEKVSYIVTETGYDRLLTKKLEKIATPIYSSESGLNVFRYVPQDY